MQADRLYLVGLSTTQRNSGLRESLLKGGRDELGKREVGKSGVEVAQVPAYAGMTVESAGMTEMGRRNDGGGDVQCGGRGAAWTIGARTTGVANSQHPTPHLTSPLKGGRDEFSWWSGEVRVGEVRVGEVRMGEVRAARGACVARWGAAPRATHHPPSNTPIASPPRRDVAGLALGGGLRAFLGL